MPPRTLRRCIDDLFAAGHLVRHEEPVDARLEAAEIHRRVFRSGGPAILFTNVRGCRFPMASNLFGTIDRARFLFRDTLDRVRRLIELKVDPAEFLKRPGRHWRTPLAALSMRPTVRRTGPVLANEAKLGDLPQLVSWPDDGGAFITLPQVLTEDPERPGLARANLGMYRVQISGGKYAPDHEAGLHYQIHRGIGVHHAAARRRGEPLRVSIFVGGSPAMTLAAVMPLPEGMSELGFAGALAGHRIPMIRRAGEAAIYAEADFCITGHIDPQRTAPEGPFGDHLGYYSLRHEFPLLRVERVTHRDDAIWPFTVVGRPPQEDTAFGQLIHELTGPVIPTVIPGVSAVHAVDAAGVHPLLLAIGSERYTPHQPVVRPQELLTQANAVLGQGQMSLAKYLWIANRDDDPTLDIHDIGAFFRHMLQRVDWRRDLHFQTETTIDTLDYSGRELNAGSKLVVAAVGPPVRELPTELPTDFRLPDGFHEPRVVLPGVVVVRAPECRLLGDSQGASQDGNQLGSRSDSSLTHTHSVDTHDSSGVPCPRGSRTNDGQLDRFCRSFGSDDPLCRFPLIVLADDSDFAARTLDNFLWVTFTRSDPAADTDGIGSFVDRKHWGCRGSLVIDARTKPHHAPPLIEDPEIVRRVDALAARGGPLARYL